MHVSIRSGVTTGNPRTGLSSRIGIIGLPRAAGWCASAFSAARAHCGLREPRRLLGDRDGNGVLDDAYAREIPLGRAIAAQHGKRDAALLGDDLLDGRMIESGEN